MHFVMLQVVDGFRFDPAWVVAGISLVVTTLSGTVAVLYRGQIGALRERIAWLQDELKKRDTREDRLIDQLSRTADAVDRSVSLQERGLMRR